MWTDTIVILTPILLAVIAAVAVVRLTFRYSASVREAVFSPLVFAICGGLIGISFGMLVLADSEGRVVIGKGILVLVPGVTLGTVAGYGAQELYSRLNRGKTAAFVFVVVLLGGCVGAPIGWLVGEIEAPGSSSSEFKFDYEQGLRRFAASRMALGIAIGSAVGLLLGLSEVLFRRRAT